MAKDERSGSRMGQVESRNAELEQPREAVRSAKLQSRPFSTGKPNAERQTPGRKKDEGSRRNGHRATPPEPHCIVDAQLPECCPHCGEGIEFQRWAEQFQIEVGTVVTRFRVGSGRCRGCRRPVQGCHPDRVSAGPGATDSQPGPRTMAWEAWLRNGPLGLSSWKSSPVGELGVGISAGTNSSTSSPATGADLVPARNAGGTSEMVVSGGASKSGVVVTAIFDTDEEQTPLSSPYQSELLHTSAVAAGSRPPQHEADVANDGRYIAEISFFDSGEGARSSNRGIPRYRQTRPERGRGGRRRRASRRVRRNRTVMTAATAVTAVLVMAVAQLPSTPPDRLRLAAADSGTTEQGSPSLVHETPSTLPSIAPALPGPPRVIDSGSKQSGALALTFDDGYCDRCVAGLVAGAERTGAHITLCPNGMYGPTAWDRYAARIKTLMSRGQVAICNHTWAHKDLTKLDAVQVRAELTKNERWIQATFGVTSRPFFRPPFGSHNAAVDRIAAELGYTKVLMWSGSLEDSYTHVPGAILSAMRDSAKPGGVILAHGNHPVTATLFDELVRITQQAGLKTVTVAELFPDAQ